MLREYPYSLCQLMLEICWFSTGKKYTWDVKITTIKEPFGVLIMVIVINVFRVFYKMYWDIFSELFSILFYYFFFSFKLSNNERLFVKNGDRWTLYRVCERKSVVRSHEGTKRWITRQTIYLITYIAVKAHVHTWAVRTCRLNNERNRALLRVRDYFTDNTAWNFFSLGN